MRYRAFIFALILAFFHLSCAISAKKESAFKTLSPFYIKSEGRDGYYFALNVIRLLERRGAQITKEVAGAHSRISVEGPSCQRTPLLLSATGSSTTDYRIRCLVHYDIHIDEQDIIRSGSLSASDNLIGARQLSAFYRREEEVMNKIANRLASQLIRTLEHI